MVRVLIVRAQIQMNSVLAMGRVVDPSKVEARRTVQADHQHRRVVLDVVDPYRREPRNFRVVVRRKGVVRVICENTKHKQRQG